MFRASIQSYENDFTCFRACSKDTTILLIQRQPYSYHDNGMQTVVAGDVAAYSTQCTQNKAKDTWQKTVLCRLTSLVLGWPLFACSVSNNKKHVVFNIGYRAFRKASNRSGCCVVYVEFYSHFFAIFINRRHQNWPTRRVPNSSRPQQPSINKPLHIAVQDTERAKHYHTRYSIAIGHSTVASQMLWYCGACAKDY